MGVLLRSIAPSATIMIFSLFIPARFYKEVVERQHDRKTETVAAAASEARGQNERLCLHFAISKTLLTLQCLHCINVDLV